MVSMKPAGHCGKERFFGMISGGIMSRRIAAQHRVRDRPQSVGPHGRGQHHADERAQADQSVRTTACRTGGVAGKDAIVSIAVLDHVLLTAYRVIAQQAPSNIFFPN